MIRSTFTSHINYTDKSLPASLADTLATPLRWASGKGKIQFQADTFKKTQLSDVTWKRVGYRTMGVGLVVLGTITIVPLLTTLLLKVAVGYWDEGAKKTCKAFAQFKEPQNPLQPKPDFDSSSEMDAEDEVSSLTGSESDSLFEYSGSDSSSEIDPEIEKIKFTDELRLREASTLSMDKEK